MDNEPSRAKVFHKNSIAVSALSGCILAAYARKHDCLSCKKGLCCSSSTTFCVGQTAVSTERLTGRYTRLKRERVFEEDFCPGRFVFAEPPPLAGLLIQK